MIKVFCDTCGKEIESYNNYIFSVRCGLKVSDELLIQACPECSSKLSTLTYIFNDTLQFLKKRVEDTALGTKSKSK